MKHNITATWKNDLQFDSLMEDHHLTIDVPNPEGNPNSGPSPKILMLTALAGCTGMDIVSILQKMKVQFDAFTIDVEATLTDEHPKYYDAFHLVFTFTAKEHQLEKYKRAIELSQDKYCGVAFMYKHFAKVTYEIKTI